MNERLISSTRRLAQVRQILKAALDDSRAPHITATPEETMDIENKLPAPNTTLVQIAAIRTPACVDANPAAPAGVQEDRRRCKPCGTTRGGTACWKCGTATFEPSPLAGDDPRLPPIDRIRELAKEVGYAIGVHGSQQRDLDVIAAPWSDLAVGNHALLEHIAKGLTTENGPARIVEVERKPLGRYAATIQMDGWYKNLDISVCPSGQYETLKYPAPTPAPSELVRDERVAFESWMNNARFFPAELSFARIKSPSGRDEYANSHHQSCWEGWQARAAFSANATPSLAKPTIS